MKKLSVRVVGLRDKIRKSITINYQVEVKYLNTGRKNDAKPHTSFYWVEYFNENNQLYLMVTCIALRRFNSTLELLIGVWGRTYSQPGVPVNYLISLTVSLLENIAPKLYRPKSTLI